MVFLAVTGVCLRRRLLPDWAGAEARLAELVLTASTAVVVLQGLGVLGILRRAEVLVVAGALALVATRLGRPGRAVHLERPRSPRALVAVAWLCCSVVTAQWITSVRSAARTGIQSVDALNYHLVYAAHFARDGSVLGLQRLDGMGATSWYPLNDELLHAAGMVLLGTDALSLGLGLVSLAAALLSVWVLAAPHGAGPTALVGTCVALLCVGPDYASSASNDWSSTWPLVAAMALVAEARRRGAGLPLPVVALTGLAGGLAVGTKLTVLAPAFVVLVVVVVLSVGHRRRALAVSLGAHLLTGGLWYVHYLLLVGNPVPVLKVGVGSFALPRPAFPELDRVSFSVLHYATNGEVVRRWYGAGLQLFFGPAWPVIVLLVAVGLVLAVRSGDGLVRGAGVVGLVSVAAYLVTPTGAGGLVNMPFLFRYNIRYALVGLVLGLLGVALAAGPRTRAVLTVVLAAVAGTTAFRSHAWVLGWPTSALLLTGAVLAAGLLGWFAVSRCGRRLRLALAPLVAVAVLLAAAPVERHYEQHRYAGDGGARDQLFAAARGLTGVRVGVVGFPLSYPFFGPRLKNDVVYLGQVGSDSSFGDYQTCQAFREGAADQKVQVIAIIRPNERVVPAAMAWTRSDPAAHLLLTSAAGAVFRLDGALDPQTCQVP